MSAQVNFVCEQHPDPDLCPDKLVRYTPRFREYGLLIHDGGSSSRVISFCPWCGTRLPESLRDTWFERMDALGVDWPTQEPPPEYADPMWWSKT
jgi:hypothetical protein